MMQGVLNFVTGPSPEAKTLRDKCSIYICPMLNCDGVILGNYRTGLEGLDLNRQWRDPNRLITPSIWHWKKPIARKCSPSSPSGDNGCRGGTVPIFLDLHGHSRKKNLFVYGCNTQSHEEQLFPYLLYQADKRAATAFTARPACVPTDSVAKVKKNSLTSVRNWGFSLNGSRFRISPDKAGTGRVVCHTLGVSNALTLRCHLLVIRMDIMTHAI